MTDERIEHELKTHARRIERAQREGWLLQPIPLEQRAFDLRMNQMKAAAKSSRGIRLSRSKLFGKSDVADLHFVKPSPRRTGWRIQVHPADIVDGLKQKELLADLKTEELKQISDSINAELATRGEQHEPQ